MQRSNPETVTLNDILITEELSRRAPRSPNWQAEAEAMRSLAQQMARDSQSLMQTLADTALKLCEAGTAGVSLLETTLDGEEIFRWTVLAGTLAHHVEETIPRNFSPCGVCLDQGSPVLFSHPERYFTSFQEANTPIVEGLVLPLIADNHVFGTIWIMSHDEGRQFDAEAVRVMTSLADFTTAALLLQQRQTADVLATNAALETETVERQQVEDQTHALIANLPGGAAFVVDRDLRYLLAEGEALAIAGFKSDDFVGRTIFEALPPELATNYEPMYRKALVGEPFEDEHQSHGHTYISRGTPLRAENGEIYAVLVVSYDISERKRVEDERKQTEVALRESEARLQAIANLVPDLLWDSEPDGSTNWYNQRWMEYTGQTFEQAIGWGWIDAIHPDDREGSARRYREVVEQGMPLQQEHRIRRHDGVYRWFVVKASPLKDESGKVIKMYGAATDIHERRVALEALRESEARFRTLADTAPALIWHNDAQGNNLFLNQYFLDFTGKSVEEIRGEGWHELVHPEDAAAYIADYLAAVREQRSWHNRNRIRRHDGVWRWHDNYAQPLFGGDGVYLGHVGVTIDNTDAIEAEINLRESEAKYRSLFESIDEGFCIIERVTVEPLDFRYLAANSAFVAQSGIPDVVGKTIRQVVPSEPEEWFEIYDHVLRTHEPIRFERELVTVGRELELYAFPVTDHSDNQLAVIFKDITERKCHEASLAFLAEISQDLVHLTNIDETMDAIGAKIGEHFNVARVIFSEISEDQRTGCVSHEWHQPDLPDMKGTYAIKDYFSPEFELLHCAGEIAVVHDTATDERVDGDRYAALGVGAFVGVPLIRQDKWRFYFSLLDSKPHDWRNNEIELLRELTTRIWTRLERARAEVALRQSEAKYRSLFDSIDEGFAIAEVIYDSAGQPIDLLYLEANPAASRLTGVPDYTGRRLSEFSPDFKSYWVELYDRVAKSGVSERTEQYAAPLNRWYDFYVFRVEAAEPSGSYQVAVVFQDITERKLHERQQKFLLQLSDALRPIADPIAIQETTSRMAAEHLDIGRVAYCEIRYEPDIVVIVEHDWPRRGMPLIAAGRYRMSDFGSFLAEEFAAGRPAIVADVATDPRIPPTDRENWSVFEITASCGLPVIKEGRFVAYLVAQDNQPHDWTDREIELLRELSERTWAAVERARAEAALRESEQRLSVIFAQAAVGLSEISLDGHFEQVNDALCRMLGRSRQELLAATVPQVTHPEDISKSLDALAQLLETGESISLDKRYLRSDDTFFWANSILTRLDDEHGQPRHILAVTVDLSDRKQAEANQMQLIREQSAREEERQRAESLAELNRAKTAFFSNVSHEFRTPLTLSLAPLQDALSDRTHPLDPVHRERLELVHHNSLRLLKLVNTLLDFSRIEAGRMEAVYEPTDLATYTAELASVFRSAIERAGLQLVIDCPPLPEPVFVDREMWEKIVLNLLSNAFKFTFEGEIRVELRMKNKECRMKTNQNSEFSIPTSQFPYVQLTISDTGAGIAPEHLPHLFERFYQVRGTQARTHEGSGIGLALVNELVQLQGGTIEVSSTVGEGTYFTVSLLLGTDHLPSERLRRDGTGRLQDEGAPRSGSVPGRQPVRTLASTAMRATTYVEEAERWLPAEGNREWGMGNGEEVSTPPPSSLLPPPPLAHVLVVDDNADMREYLTRILSEHVPVEAVADGATALAVAQERVPDLILSDVMMPGLDGFELLETLRADPLTRDIPIILLSARAGEEAIVEGLEAGADDYLIKPFSAQELVSRVTAHLQMAQLRGEALQEARSTLRSRDEFISVISHELNTPLVSILGWTRMLRSSPSNPVMLNKALDTIERNATLQGKLVQDLLDLSRISAGKLRLNPQPIELKPVIETAIATVAQPAADKGINLIWQDAVTEPIVVKGDGDRLQQVICNLLTNAIKFTPEAGSVRVELSVEEGGVREYEGEISPNSLLSHSPTLPYAQITITDTGIGIAANFLPYVFERFRQAQGAHSTKGLGLGLAIAHHIVELHNGTIHAESAGEGRGATFTVRLPLLQDGES